MTANIQAFSILRRPQVEARTGLSRSTIYASIKAGTFPAPISLGPKAVGWVDSDINNWIAIQIQKSRQSI